MAPGLVSVMDRALVAVRAFLPKWDWDADMHEGRCSLFAFGEDRKPLHHKWRTYCFWGATWDEVEAKVIEQARKRKAAKEDRAQIDVHEKGGGGSRPN